MPDIVRRKTHQRNLVDKKNLKKKDEDKAEDQVPLSPLHWDLGSYQPPYGRTSTTTAYGLNEPQWSEGPPPLNFEKSPYSRISLPALSATPIKIHPLLAFHAITPIVWRIRDTPSNAALAYHIKGRKLFHWLSQSAFEPSSITSITITLEPFDRPFFVFASDTTRGITIGDVLTNVYRGARAGATRIFCKDLNIDADLLEPVIQQYWEMVSQDAGSVSGDDTVSLDVARCMDFRTNWAGLTPSTKEQDVWILHTKKSGV
jgi:hypothetical protein